MNFERAEPTRGGILEQLQGGAASSFPSEHKEEFIRNVKQVLAIPAYRDQILRDGPAVFLQEILDAGKSEAETCSPGDKKIIIDHSIVLTANRRECEQIIASMIGFA